MTVIMNTIMLKKPIWKRGIHDNDYEHNNIEETKMENEDL